MRWAAFSRRPPILRGVSASKIRADHAANQARINARHGPALPSSPQLRRCRAKWVEKQGLYDPRTEGGLSQAGYQSHRALACGGSVALVRPKSGIRRGQADRYAKEIVCVRYVDIARVQRVIVETADSGAVCCQIVAGGFGSAAWALKRPAIRRQEASDHQTASLLLMLTREFSNPSRL
jgi:hypothetical protein